MNEHLTTETLIDYLHHALPPQADAAVYTHLAECPTCANAYEYEAGLSEALRINARATEREFPSGIRESVLGLIERAPARSVGFADALREWLRPAIAIPAAAAFVLVLLLVPHFAAQSGPPSIDAAYYLNDHAAMNGTMPFADATSAVPASLTTDEAVNNQSVAVLPSVLMADYAP